MTTEQLRHRMPPILKALKERSLRGRTPVESLRTPNAPTTAGTPYTPMPQAGSPLPPATLSEGWRRTTASKAR